MGTKILLKKVFLRYFPSKLILKKQGFSGFPNEMEKFLGSYKNYLIKDLFKIYNFSEVMKNIDKASGWKIVNTEMYLKNVSGINKIK